MTSQGGVRERMPAGSSSANQAARVVKGTTGQMKETNSPQHTAGGKSARSGYSQPAIAAEARPLKASRRHPETPPVSGARSSEDIRAAAAKKAAIQRAIHAGATGHYKAVDLTFGNVLLPVIPIHLLPQVPSQSPSQSPSWSPMQSSHSPSHSSHSPSHSSQVLLPSSQVQQSQLELQSSQPSQSQLQSQSQQSQLQLPLPTQPQLSTLQSPVPLQLQSQTTESGSPSHVS